ncbi:unnamed protein product, partial [Rotaria sp. Silwood2]
MTHKTRTIADSYIQLADVYLEAKDYHLAKTNLNFALSKLFEDEEPLQKNAQMIE